MQKPIAEVFTWPSDEPELLGSRCEACGATTFPAQSRCPRGDRGTMTEVRLPRRGTLVSWTTQGFPPVVPFAGEVPFGVGLVQLGDVVRVESRLATADPEELDFGMEVELTVVPFATDEDGDEIVTFAFQPVGA